MKKTWVWRRFLWVRLWEMKFLNILVHAMKKVVRYYWFPVFPACQEHKCYGFVNFWFNFELTIAFCWEDAYQQYTVQLIMGSRE